MCHAGDFLHRGGDFFFEEFQLCGPREFLARVQVTRRLEAVAEAGHESLDHVEAEELAALVLGLRVRRKGRKVSSSVRRDNW